MLPGDIPPVADARFPIVVAHPGSCVFNPVLPAMGLIGFSAKTIRSPILCLACDVKD